MPQPDDAAVESASETIEGSTASDDADEGYRDPFEQFMVFDDGAEFVYETDDEPPQESPDLQHGPIDPNKIAVPRYVLYSQGILLGVVALVCFSLGVVVGIATSGDGDEVATGPQPCYVSGRVTFEDLDGAIISDAGAVAIIVPSDAKPETKVEVVGLRPTDPMPANDSAGLTAIHQIGGDYTRADETGQYRLRVPDRGTYFLLLISNHKRRPDEDRPKTELAQMGRFFVLNPELFGQEAHVWTEETVKRDRVINQVFE